MEIAGEYTFDAPQDVVWEALQDPTVLASIIPGSEGLEQIGEDEYEGGLKIKVGPVQGKYKGKIRLENITPPESYDIHVDGRGNAGFVKGGGGLKLDGQGEKTLMTYEGTAQVGGRIASVGQRLLDSSAKAIIKQSLDALNALLVAQMQGADDEGDDEAPVDEATTTDGAGSRPAPRAAPPPPPQPPSQMAFAASVARDVAADLIPEEYRPVVAVAVGALIIWLLYSLLSR